VPRQTRAKGLEDRRKASLLCGSEGDAAIFVSFSCLHLKSLLLGDKDTKEFGNIQEKDQKTEMAGVLEMTIRENKIQ
jgi:hypothetical protein